jgi:uncharacterized membrane protein YdcZ (DUF606 family)
MANGATLVAYAVWAVIVGGSVSLQLCNSVLLNNRDTSEHKCHGLYVSALAVLIGGFVLLPRAVYSPKPFRKPSPWWHALGGLCSLPLFATIPAGKFFGTSVVLLAQLMGMLSTSLAFDIQSGEMKVTDIRRWLGFLAVVFGCTAEKLFNIGDDAATEWTLMHVVMLFLVFASGVCMALQAKLNALLVQDVGSVARSTVICALVFCVCSSPAQLYIRFGLGVAPAVHLQDLPFWLCGGLQSAFYIGSLSMIPKSLGYTGSYLALLLGKLGTSCLVDAVGLTGKTVPFTWAKALSMMVVLVGATAFSAKTTSQGEQASLKNGAGVPGTISCEGSFLQEPDTEHSGDAMQGEQGHYGACP